MLLAVWVVLTASASEDLLFRATLGMGWDCETVPGMHSEYHYGTLLGDLQNSAYAPGHQAREFPLWLGYLEFAEVRTIQVVFAPNTNEVYCDCGPDYGWDCMDNWSKLWGYSRCLHYHHTDSDRFVWRRQPEEPGTVQLAAYAYDDGNKAYQTPGLLKEFTARLTVGHVYTLTLDMTDPGLTIYSLSSGSGELIETQTITHDNACSLASYGYNLRLYYGGSCPAQTPVSVCYAR